MWFRRCPSRNSRGWRIGSVTKLLSLLWYPKWSTYRSILTRWKATIIGVFASTKILLHPPPSLSLSLSPPLLKSDKDRSATFSVCLAFDCRSSVASPASPWCTGACFSAVLILNVQRFVISLLRNRDYLRRNGWPDMRLSLWISIDRLVESPSVSNNCAPSIDTLESGKPVHVFCRVHMFGKSHSHTITSTSPQHYNNNNNNASWFQYSVGPCVILYSDLLARRWDVRCTCEGIISSKFEFSAILHSGLTCRNWTDGRRYSSNR